MTVEIDPNGDTLITFSEANNHASSSPVHPEHEISPEIRFLVSKKHLMLASRRASKVLGGPFKEATPEEDGFLHWNFEPIFDPKAFEMVMEIIHGQTRQIPVKVDAVLLTNIAVIVDDLECHNAVWYFAKGWLNQLNQRAIVFRESQDVCRWILISFVFEEPRLFHQATAEAIERSIDSMLTGDLPIRSKILDDIGEKRKSIFDNLFSRLQNLESQLLEQSLGCDQGCRAMMLGALMQGMTSSSLSPPPCSPYSSLSIRSTLSTLRAIKSPNYYCIEQDVADGASSEVWVIESKYPAYTPKGPRLVRHKCRLEDHLKGILDAAEAGIKGLELAEYLSA